MSKKTDGRSWLTVPARKIVTEYRERLRALVQMDLIVTPAPETDAAFITASQNLCRLISDQQEEIRSLKKKLGWVKRKAKFSA